jgi:hypothetical protein
LTSFGAEPQRFSEACFVLFQGVAARCGSETKGYSKVNDINGLDAVLTSFDDDSDVFPDRFKSRAWAI